MPFVLLYWGLVIKSIQLFQLWKQLLTSCYALQCMIEGLWQWLTRCFSPNRLISVDIIEVLCTMNRFDHELKSFKLTQMALYYYFRGHNWQNTTTVMIVKSYCDNWWCPLCLLFYCIGVSLVIKSIQLFQTGMCWKREACFITFLTYCLHVAVPGDGLLLLRRPAQPAFQVRWPASRGHGSLLHCRDGARDRLVT